MKLSIIAAVAANGTIGKNNKLLCKLPKDMERFREITLKSGVVVMGRNTHESLGKALKGRANIVISHNRDYVSPFDPKNVMVMNSVKSTLAMLKFFYRGDREVIVIGGEAIYREFMPYASKMYITNIYSPFDGDTYFPDVDWPEWKKVGEEIHTPDDKHRWGFSFDTFERVINSQ